MYYRLTYNKTPDGFPPSASRQRGVICSQQPLDIGQTSACDITLPERPDIVPVVCATILPRTQGWYLVRRTDYVEITLNGKEVTAATPLHHRDKIAFNDGIHTTELLFTLCKDSHYDPSAGILYLPPKRNRWIIITAIIATLASAVALTVTLLNKQHTMLRYADYDQYATSLYHIDTDSVFLAKDTLIDGQIRTLLLEAAPLSQPRRGTCFLTDQGYFVTARHCIEPWLDDDQWDGLSTPTTAELRLATIAETKNQQQNQSKYKIYTRCVISNERHSYIFRSSDFSTNRSRDIILPLGTDQNPLYLRSIIPIAQRHDMELGDFATLKAPDTLCGKLTLATEQELKKIDSQRDKDIAVLGFPIKNTSTHLVDCNHGNCQHLEYNNHGSLAACIQISAEINHGNSGGPVLALIDGQIKVIGILSKADQFAEQGTFWAVPVTEVQYIIGQGNKTIEDTMQWIR